VLRTQAKSFQENNRNFLYIEPAQPTRQIHLDGRLIDAALIRMAENLLAKLEQIEAREVETSAVAAEPG
jgi:hypothetical protein